MQCGIGTPIPHMIAMYKIIILSFEKQGLIITVA